MKIFIQTKHPSSRRDWADVDQKGMEIKNGEDARTFAKYLADYLGHYVRLATLHPENSGSYFGPKKIR